MNWIMLSLLGALLTLLFALSVESSKAQVRVTGTVMDESNVPLPSVTVLLLNPVDSVMVKGGITNEAGMYELSNITPGTYILSVSMVGFEKHTSPQFRIQEEIYQMEPIRLKESVEQLGEVAVTATRPLFEQEMDRLVVNVQSSITSSGNSALEVLEKSPGITVNRQSNSISMNGKSGVQVMINDKVIRLPVDAVVQMLNGMSAANIEKIELIHTPPAKYEAEGNAGMINIVMKEYTDRGYNGTVAGDVGFNKAETLGSSFNYSRRDNKWALFLDYSINYDRNEHYISNRRYILHKGFQKEVLSSNRRRPIIMIQNARVGFEYNLGPKTTAGILLTGYQRMWETRDISDNVNIAGPDSSLFSRMNVSETNNWKNGLISASVNHSFDDLRSLSLTVDYLNYKNDNPSFYENRFLRGNRSMMNVEGIDVNKDTPITIWVGRLDYQHQVSDRLSLEAGVKGALPQFNNNVTVSDLIDGSWAVNDEHTSVANLDEKVGAVYFSGNWNPAEDLTVSGGLRYEYTDSYLSTRTEQGLVDRQNGHLFPSVFVKKDLSEEKSLQGSYTRRITRPTFTDMAPFVFFVDPNTFFSGNPGLQSAITDGYKLDYQHGGWLVSLQYSYTNNEIGLFQPQVDAETSKQIYSSLNMDYLRTYSLTTHYAFKIARWWEVNTNLLGYYHNYRTSHLDPDVTLNVPQFNADVSNTFTLPNDFSVEVTGSYESKGIWGISQLRPQGMLNAGIQKNIADGRGTLRLSANDILGTYVWRANADIPEANLNNRLRYDMSMRSFALTFTWGFGNDKLDAVEVDAGSAEEQGRVNTNK